MIKRVVLLLALLVPCAAISIAIAWACALWDAGPTVWEQSLVLVDDRHGGWVRDTRCTTLIDVIESQYLERDRDHAAAMRTGFILAPAVRHVERTTLAQARPGSIMASGFPMRCVWVRLQKTPTDSYTVADGDWAIDAGTHQYRMISVPRVLALRPLWVGLLINALFVFAIFSFLYGGYRLWRYLRRKRRGLCTRCGYDVSGATHRRCPECGKRQPLQVVAPAA